MQRVLSKAVHHGKELLEGFIQKSVPVRAGPKVRGFGSERGQLDVFKQAQQPQVLLNSQRGFISNYLRNYSKNGLASEVGRNAARRMWNGAVKGPGSRLRIVSQRLAMYGFVGVSLVGSSQRQEELDPLPICKHISELFSAVDFDSLQGPPMGKKVEDYQFGHLIATGCDAAVYEAQPTIQPSLNLSLDTPSESSIQEEEAEVDGSVDSEPVSFEVISESGDMSVDVMSVGSGEGFDVISDGEPSDDESTSSGASLSKDTVGIKVMFNYGTESNASAIEQAMQRELVAVPVPDRNDNDHLVGAHVKKKRLPPHPNIARMYGHFVDTLPLLEAAYCMYPMALPPRLHTGGYGRNSTLFIVMKRYDSSLADYLHEYGPREPREGTLLLLQLVNAIQHMGKHHVAHRDLKSDNLLLDLSSPCPELVVSDFGHCLVGDAQTWGLRLPYVSSCMDKGGNGKLMAPEISSADPGISSHLDFRCSDLWAAGTLAYEIFAGANPFYTDLFDSRSYSEADIPRLPAEVPKQVARAVYSMLAREPEQRLSSGVIRHLLSLSLWAPPTWHHQPPCKVTVLRWLVSLAAQSIIQGGRDAEQQQLQLFLANLEWDQLERALELFCDV